MQHEDLKSFLENVDSEIKLFGEDIVFRKIKLLQSRGWYFGRVTSPFFTHFCKDRDFRSAQKSFDLAMRSGNAGISDVFTDLQNEAIRRGVPPICLISLPKSGSVYLQNAVSHAVTAPHLQLSLARFPNDYLISEALRLFVKGGVVSQTHLDARTENLDALHDAGIRRLHVHVRDPRQATISWAIFMAREIQGGLAHRRYLTDPFEPVDIDTESEPWRMEWYAGNHYPACIRWILQWVRTAENDPRFIVNFTDHAELQSDRVGTLRSILVPYGCTSDSITEHTIPPPEPGKRHFRQGSNSEWRDLLPPHVQDWMNDMLPQQLKQRFGWPDR